MNKQKFQDIKLGFFNYQKVIQNSQNAEDATLKHESNFYNIYYDENGKVSRKPKTISPTNNEPKVIQNINPSTQATPGIPQRTVIYHSTNLFTANMVNQR